MRDYDNLIDSVLTLGVVGLATLALMAIALLVMHLRMNAAESKIQILIQSLRKEYMSYDKTLDQ